MASVHQEGSDRVVEKNVFVLQHSAGASAASLTESNVSSFYAGGSLREASSEEP